MKHVQVQYNQLGLLLRRQQLPQLQQAGVKHLYEMSDNKLRSASRPDCAFV